MRDSRLSGVDEKEQDAEPAVDHGQLNLGKANLTWASLSTGQNGQAVNHDPERA
ncbi:hypothetical protein [Streptomyces sp. KLOTTS4A1]|uniref:hypothetical protein n=1 Tax=Streptomyces sp. KLOTTS4A1 TaxID=3390996 RepID=UPI0039F56A0D